MGDSLQTLAPWLLAQSRGAQVFDDWQVGLSGVVALAAVAAIGYLFGRRGQSAPTPVSRQEIERAKRIARELEQIADGLRQELALHRSQVDRFKNELRRAETADSDETWKRLRDEADGMVEPTLRLVGQLSTAYDKIRQQSHSLTHFTGGRTDPLTGLANRRSLEEQLAVMLNSAEAGRDGFAVVVVALDPDAVSPGQREEFVCCVGKSLSDALRGGDDFAARYGVDDFVAVITGATLAGAGSFARRFRTTLRGRHGLSVCCGIAESMPADTPRSLLARADSAAYSAQAAGPGRQYSHTGAAIREDRDPAPELTAMPRLSAGDSELAAVASALPGPLLPGTPLAPPAG
ncbi:MAG: GGDEF domain-containing protein [Planctomycetota bacterium]